MRRFFFVLTGLVFVGFSFWGLRLFLQNQDNRQALSRQEETIRKLGEDLRKEQRRNSAGVEGEKEALDQLRQKFDHQKDTVDTLEQQLRISKNLGEPGQTEIPLLEDKMQKEKDLMAALERQLQDVKNQESNLGSQGKIAQNEGRLGQRANEVALDDQVRSEEQALQDLNTQMSQLKKQPRDFDSLQQIEALSPQISDKKALIQQLKERKRLANQEWGTQLTSSQIQIEKRHLDLKKNEDLLRDQLQAEKLAYQEYDRQAQALRKSRSSQKDSVHQLEGQYQTEKAKLQQLGAELKERTRELQEMTQ